MYASSCAVKATETAVNDCTRCINMLWLTSILRVLEAGTLGRCGKSWRSKVRRVGASKRIICGDVSVSYLGIALTRPDLSGRPESSKDVFRMSRMSLSSNYKRESHYHLSFSNFNVMDSPLLEDLHLSVNVTINDSKYPLRHRDTLSNRAIHECRLDRGTSLKKCFHDPRHSNQQFKCCRKQDNGLKTSL
ncbi:hypothetical protein J6590_002644 [Homalodisca vitripennis]|nr:hypothetical protein J6590_002644 [Homalodisca vitripennis]